MGTHSFFEFPTELEFLEAFALEPIKAVPEDGYWLYKTTDRSGVTLERV